MDIVIQVDEVLYNRFRENCEAIGVIAIDYMELKVNELMKKYVDDITSAPGIDDARCHVQPGDE